MARTSYSLDSKEGSHFSGRLPPPYHLVDVTKQFSFSYATPVGHEDKPKDADGGVLEDHQSSVSSLSDLDPELMSCVYPIETLETATQLPAGSPSAKLHASITVTELWNRVAMGQYTPSKLSSSEDGGCLLPLSSTSNSMDIVARDHLQDNFDTVPEIESLLTHLKPRSSGVVRYATASAPIRARIEANYVSRALTAATNHQQYASYRRQFDRNRNTLGKTPPPSPVDGEVDRYRLISRNLFKYSEPWALSSVSSWLKDIFAIETLMTEDSILQFLEMFFEWKALEIKILVNASSLSRRVLNEMIASGTVIKDGDFFQFGSVITTGVLVEFTSRGCYSSRAHATQTEYSCYSCRCQRWMFKSRRTPGD